MLLRHRSPQSQGHHNCRSEDGTASAFVSSPSLSLSTEESARQTLLDWNFDPNDVSKGENGWCSSPLLSRPTSAALHHYVGDVRKSRPMILFAQLGDLPMMQHILANTTLDDPLEEFSKTDEYGLFPLYTAISEPHPEDNILTVCQWLHSHGANLRQTLADEWSPLSRACLKGFDKVAIWLVSNGALLQSQRDENTQLVPFDMDAAERDLPPNGDYYGVVDQATQSAADRVHCNIFDWAKDILSTRDVFFLFLSGTLLPPLVLLPCSSTATPSAEATTSDFQIQRAIQRFNGHSGVLELISQYVGVETKLDVLCTARGLVRYRHKKEQERAANSYV